MRLARNVVLILATAIVAMAFAASSASAQNIEISDEAGNPCNPCNIHFVGESQITNGGNPVFTCEDEFEAELYHSPTNGVWGHIYHYENANHLSIACPTQKCTGTPEGATETEWAITDLAETDINAGEFEIDLCLEAKPFPNLAGTHCDGYPIQFAEPTQHNYTFTLDTVCVENGNRIVGSWRMEDPHTPAEGHTEIEFEHLD